jgi:hypothetical protein
MSRICLLMVLAAAAGFAGCAVCDTCDDFPVPCIGPNCGQLAPGGIPGYFGDSMGPQASQAMPVMGTSTPMTPPAYDSAGPAPAMPAPSATLMTPAVNPGSPPAPMEPGVRTN